METVWTVWVLKSTSKQCFDFLNSFLRIIRNENSRARINFSHRLRACQEAWFIWAHFNKDSWSRQRCPFSSFEAALSWGYGSEHQKVWVRACFKVGHAAVQLAPGWVMSLSHRGLSHFHPHLILPAIAPSQIRWDELQVSTNLVIFGDLGFNG